MAFQQAKRLAVDGIVGPQTWGALDRDRPARADRATRCAACRRSSSSATCPAIPARASPIDGIFGPKTDAAVRGFQQALHADIPSVAVDGIVGPVTWQALVSGMLSF